jgi:cell wall-associated NlpC family hydrolase
MGREAERRTRARWARALGALVAAAGSMAVAGSMTQPSAAAPAPSGPTHPGTGGNFWMATPAGPVEAFGATNYGSPNSLNQPVVGASTTTSGKGYWLVAGDGGIFNYGDAPFYGSTGSIRLNKPIVGIAPTGDGLGYWMVATDGGIFNYGDAGFHGSTGAITLNKPVVGMAPTPDSNGYWLVASDGGIFSFGDAGFYGSTGAITLNQPIVAMAATPDGKGYWLVAADGGLFSFGDAAFYGSAAGSTGEPVEKMIPTGDGKGYWLVEQNGTALPYGDAAGRALPPYIVLLQPTTPGDKAVLFAVQQLGKPYIWGGNGPQGYDCSGLALTSWEDGAGVGFARVANDQYHTAGSPVPLDQLQAGDLIFWGYVQSDWTSVYHTAIYVGNDFIVESTGNHVQLNWVNQWGLSDLMPNGRRP